MLEKHLLSDAKAENGLSFEDVSSCIRPTSWVNDDVRSCFFVYLQKFSTNFMYFSTMITLIK